MAGLQSGLGFSPYATSKFAVVAMSEGLAMQLEPLGIGVTVLCPGFVRTRISGSGRNRPERYGPARAPDPASPAGRLAAESARLQQAGLDPADIAAQALTAIREEELYVFTHPEMHGFAPNSARTTDIPGGATSGHVRGCNTGLSSLAVT
jgi:NAD(P)-dependent dehydrogenase (short-subunit alcohol dehydrogenase family)